MKPRPTKNKPARTAKPQGGSSFLNEYFVQSKAPYTVLLFLLPLLLAYELLLFISVRAMGELVVPDAHRWILNLFEAFELGTFGLWLPGVMVVAVLVIWHSIERHPWRADGAVIGLMWSESIVLALPLMVFSQAALRIPATPALAASSFDALPLGAKIAVSVGAGIYEELLFRLALIGLLTVFFRDVCGAGRGAALAWSVALSSVAFMLYHPLRGAGGAVSPARVVFYLAAGAYFGMLFVVRGFGIAVGAHAFYDILSALFAATAVPAHTAGDG